MQNMAFITQSTIDLNDIRELAERNLYKTEIFIEIYETLNIHFGKDVGEWWQWRKIEEQELWFDDPTDYKQLKDIAHNSIFVIQYHANALQILTDFLKTILKQYGGWVDCKGSLKNAYTLENIDKIVLECK